MKISTVSEFREDPGNVLRSKDPVLVTRRGRLAGIFFPQPESSLPLELKREMFGVLTADIGRQLERRGLSEEEILTDFASWRKSKRASGRRR
jgi:hypothetical protein